MYHDFTYEATLAASMRAQWQLDDVLRADQELDFSRNFMPEALARTAAAPGLSANERRLLNQISAHQYLCMFRSVEEFVLPFLLDHAKPMLREDDFRVRALLNFASEEAKHIHLFKRFHEAFVRGFPVRCDIIGPSEHLAGVVLSKHPLATGLVTLMVEWMTHSHYVGSARGEQGMDPLFKSLLRHHWMEEAQHAKLDTLIVDALAEGRGERELDGVVDEFLQVCAYLDECLKVQARFNVEALERAAGRTVPERQQLMAQQYRASRWTYLGSGFTHPRFKATLNAISPRNAARVQRIVEAAARPRPAPPQPAPA